MSKKQKPIIGGIFGTHTEWDENGNVTVKDDFHLRIYWDLFHSGAIKNLKGNMLHVYLTIAMHLDNRGEGWPTQERIAKLCGINRETVVNAIKKLSKAGFIEAEKMRTKGKFDNTVYKIKFAPQTNQNNHDGKSDMEKNEENKGSDHVGKSDTDDNTTMSEKPTRKNQHDKSDTKEDLSFKKDPSLKKDFDDDAARVPEKWESNSKYIAFRDIFTDAGADDIRLHGDHYQKFLDAVEKIGFVKLLETAEKYIQAEGKAAQIVLFLSGLYNQYLPKENKPASKKRNAKVAKMPVSFQQQQNAQNEINQGLQETGAGSDNDDAFDGEYIDLDEFIQGRNAAMKKQSS